MEEATVAGTLREVREARDMKVSALAAAAGITPGFLSRLEHGDSAPSDRVALAITTALGVPPGTFTYPQPARGATLARMYCAALALPWEQRVELAAALTE